ncbi:hypothetical protein EVAR_24660_1 [Eumeta japonica]|uniref:Uncharacterized protein n=1 Tax=Eumeta variegata TaxID=151549 RepID=A0A4C1V2F0_EUMVA|nr:hypothetical protein EVAR_24660_1 [Eumeta japonica]
MFVKNFVHLTHTDRCLSLSKFAGRSLFVSLYHEPHSTDVVFGHRRKRTSLTQIVIKTLPSSYQKVPASKAVTGEVTNEFANFAPRFHRHTKPSVQLCPRLTLTHARTHAQTPHVSPTKFPSLTRTLLYRYKGIRAPSYMAPRTTAHEQRRPRGRATLGRRCSCSQTKQSIGRDESLPVGGVVVTSQSSSDPAKNIHSGTLAR